jgi:hypothetical protein
MPLSEPHSGVGAPAEKAGRQCGPNSRRAERNGNKKSQTPANGQTKKFVSRVEQRLVGWPAGRKGSRLARGRHSQDTNPKKRGLWRRGQEKTGREQDRAHWRRQEGPLCGAARRGQQAVTGSHAVGPAQEPQKKNILLNMSRQRGNLGLRCAPGFLGLAIKGGFVVFTMLSTLHASNVRETRLPRTFMKRTLANSTYNNGRPYKTSCGGGHANKAPKLARKDGVSNGANAAATSYEEPFRDGRYAHARAATQDPALQHTKMAARSRISTRIRVPRRTVGSRPLQHLPATFFCCIRACTFIRGSGNGR